MLYWLRAGVGWLLRSLANRFDPMGTTPTTLSLGITSDVGAVANFLTECAKGGLDLLELFDNPQMVQGRANVAKERQADQTAKDVDSALSGGDPTAIEKDLS